MSHRASSARLPDNAADQPSLRVKHMASKPPFKADVVGSLLRPQSIFDAREEVQQGKLSAAELRAVESRAVREAVALQKAAGLKVCTDGEFHRRHWFLDFLERIDGVEVHGGLATRFHTEKGDI